MDKDGQLRSSSIFFSHPSYIIFKICIIFFKDAKVGFWLPIDNSEDILYFTIRAILDTKSLTVTEETTVPKAI